MLGTVLEELKSDLEKEKKENEVLCSTHKKTIEELKAEVGSLLSEKQQLETVVDRNSETQRAQEEEIGKSISEIS